MTTVNDVLSAAAKYIGTAENPPNSNHVVGITDWYGIDRAPWCAMFVSKVFSDAGMPLQATTPKGFAYCPFGVNYFKARLAYEQTPRVGAVVFFEWPGKCVASHVGIVETVNADGSIISIEGNTNMVGSYNGGEVRRMHRKADILGYGYPDYDENSTVKENLTVRQEEDELGNWQNVKKGDRGDSVRVVQGLLVARGRKLAIDGDFGNLTEAALKAWQASNSLESDGIFGKLSLKRALGL
jgi:hypothetical protein